MDLGSEIPYLMLRWGQRKSYDVSVYMSIFLNYFSLIIFIIFALLFECKALPGLDGNCGRCHKVQKVTSISFAELLWRNVEALRHGIEGE